MRWSRYYSAFLRYEMRQHFLNFRDEPQKQGLLLYLDSFLKYYYRVTEYSSFYAFLAFYRTSLGASS